MKKVVLVLVLMCLFALGMAADSLYAGHGCAGNARVGCAGRIAGRIASRCAARRERRAARGCAGVAVSVDYGCPGAPVAPSCAGQPVAPPACVECPSQAIAPAPVPVGVIYLQPNCVGPNCPPQASVERRGPLRTLLSPLARLNARRASVGLFALQEDAHLTAVAISKSNHRASRRITNHDGSSLAGARGEGVGWGSGQFHTCYWNTRSHRLAGAATSYDVAGRPYHTLLVR